MFVPVCLQLGGEVLRVRLPGLFFVDKVDSREEIKSLPATLPLKAGSPLSVARRIVGATIQPMT